MTDSNGVKPSKEQLQSLIEKCRFLGPVSVDEFDVIESLARAELQRQQPDPYAIHTCSYHCSRPECIKRQRDQMRDWIHDTLGNQKFTEMMTYKKEPPTC